MSFISRIFNRDESKKQCPRCLGKGHVDHDDIKRLKQELKWLPGKCAYCNGSGKVDQNLEERVAADTTYLVNNIPEAERQRILSGHPDALRRGKQREAQLDHLIEQITYLHFEKHLPATDIVSFLLTNAKSDLPPKEKQDFVTYVQSVIDTKSNDHEYDQ